MDHETIEADNLVERYVLGRLPVDEQVRFEEHFTGCHACTEELEMARELRVGIREAATEDVGLVLGGSLAATLARRRRWLAPLAAVVLALPALWLVMRSQDPGGELTEAPRPLANVPTFLLEVTRGDVPVPVLEIPDGQDWLALSVEVAAVEAELGISSYDATLEDAAGDVLWQEEALVPNLWDVLLVTLPRAFLPPGEYRLVLAAAASGDGGDEPAVVYPFRIE